MRYCLFFNKIKYFFICFKERFCAFLAQKLFAHTKFVYKFYSGDTKIWIILLLQNIFQRSLRPTSIEISLSVWKWINSIKGYPEIYGSKIIRFNALNLWIMIDYFDLLFKSSIDSFYCTKLKKYLSIKIELITNPSNEKMDLVHFDSDRLKHIFRLKVLSY